MSEITIASTTDTPEQVAAALGLETPAKDESKDLATLETADASGTPGSDESTEGKEKKPDTSKIVAKDDSTDDESDDELDDKDTTDHTKGKGGFQNKINKLTARNKALALEIETLKTKPATLEVKEKSVVVEKEITIPTLRSRPKPADYGDYDSFLEDLGKWDDERTAVLEAKHEVALNTKLKEQAEALRKAQEDKETKTTNDKIKETFIARRKVSEALHDDFSDIVDNSPVMLSAEVANVVIQHELGNELIYHLSLDKNADEAARIFALPPYEQLLEVGVILSTLKSKPATKEEKKVTTPPVKVSKAPDPIPRKKAVSGAGNSSQVLNQKAIDDMPYAEYKKLRAEGVIR